LLLAGIKGGTMSNWAEQERMLERIQEAQSCRSYGKLAKDSPEAIQAWKPLIRRLREEVKSGNKSGEDWSLENFNWLTVTGLGFVGRTCFVGDVVSGNRILIYLAENDIQCSDQEILYLVSEALKEPKSFLSLLEKYVFKTKRNNLQKSKNIETMNNAHQFSGQIDGKDIYSQPDKLGAPTNNLPENAGSSVKDRLLKTATLSEILEYEREGNISPKENRPRKTVQSKKETPIKTDSRKKKTTTKKAQKSHNNIQPKSHSNAKISLWRLVFGIDTDGAVFIWLGWTYLAMITIPPLTLFVFFSLFLTSIIYALTSKKDSNYTPQNYPPKAPKKTDHQSSNADNNVKPHQIRPAHQQTPPKSSTHAHHCGKRCNRCSGSGYIHIYSHIDNGVCYKCHGSGEI
jgi:hypothetical protein